MASLWIPEVKLTGWAWDRAVGRWAPTLTSGVSHSPLMPLLPRALPPACGCHRTGWEAAAGLPCPRACPRDSPGAGSRLDIGREEVRVQLRAVVRGP